MAGRRSLTKDEEKRLLAVVRKFSPRDRALVCMQWFTGFRISEVLSLTVGHVYREGAMRGKIGLAPRFLKGKRGNTRWVPISPELYRALAHHIWHLRLRFELRDNLPLFPSRQAGCDGDLKTLTRVQAYNIIMRAFDEAGIEDDGRLGTHSLRKTLARKAYEECGRDLIVLRSVLGHRDVTTTQQYLEPDEDRVMAAIRSADFTRERRPAPKAGSSAKIIPMPVQVSVPVGKQMTLL